MNFCRITGIDAIADVDDWTAYVVALADGSARAAHGSASEMTFRERNHFVANRSRGRVTPIPDGAAVAAPATTHAIGDTT
jgi:hypothetical protein